MALAFKYVDDVVIGAPYIINEDLIKSLNIDKVVHVLTEEDRVKPEFAHVDPYLEAKNQGIYVELPAIENDLTLEKIALRVAKNKASFEKKFTNRKAKQDSYYSTKGRISEGTPEALSMHIDLDLFKQASNPEVTPQTKL